MIKLLHQRLCNWKTLSTFAVVHFLKQHYTFMENEMNVNEWANFLINMKDKTELSRKLADVEDFISWGCVSKKYMDKPVNWMYDHLIGYLRTGEKVPEPTKEELMQLKVALQEMAEKLKFTAEKL